MTVAEAFEQLVSLGDRGMTNKEISLSEDDILAIEVACECLIPVYLKSQAEKELSDKKGIVIDFNQAVSKLKKKGE